MLEKICISILLVIAFLLAVFRAVAAMMGYTGYIFGLIGVGVLTLAFYGTKKLFPKKKKDQTK